MSFLNDLTVGEIVARIGAFLIYSLVQSGLLIGLARLFGDRRPGREGRGSISPLVHLSLSGLAMATLFRMGWIRPLRFDVEANKGGRIGLVLVAVLGLAGMIVFVALLDYLRPVIQTNLPQTGGYVVLNVVVQLQQITIGTVVLNILPVPGLIGAAFLQAAWPKAEPRMRRLEPYFTAALVVLLILGWIPNPMPTLLPYISRL